MKDNLELEKKDIRIDPDMQIEDSGRQIVAYLETWFDVEKKFGVVIDHDADEWVNVYAIYDPYDDTLGMECILEKPETSELIPYQPTQNEQELLKEMITETIRQEYQQTPQEYCESVMEDNQDITMY